MQHYRPDPSISSAASRDAETATHASQKPSTAPTSTLPPQLPVMSFSTHDGPDRQRVPNSTTLPALASRDNRRNRALPSSATWTSSAADLALFPDTDVVESREFFVQEYNSLAKKHGIRILVVGDFEGRPTTPAAMSEKRRWWSRMFRSPSSGQPSISRRPSRSIKHRRSISDLALNMVAHRRPERRIVDLQTMVRLSGKNFLYLPEPYAPSSLMLPTCFRATAQYLVQYGPETRGIFRIPGSIRGINAIFDYYCDEKAGEEVTNTIRCASLPTHINVGIHDIASAFKKFLSVLPGGILGTLTLFDALVAIQCQLRGEPELSRTKETKLRARLIALAIGTVKSQFQRELICAVFGLLSVIGRAGETAAREDERGHPLPTSDLMGYTALGIVFGPLLVGDLLDSYTMKLATPSAGLLLFPLTPPQLKRERQRTAKAQDEPPLPAINKVHVANEIAEMLITNWREVVKNMRDLRILIRIDQGVNKNARHKSHWSSSSDPFTIGLPRGWKSKSATPGATINRDGSPTPDSPTPTCSRSACFLGEIWTNEITRIGTPARSAIPDGPTHKLDVQKVRPQVSLSPSPNRLPPQQSLHSLSPTAEESTANYHGVKRIGSKQSNVKIGFSKTSSMRTRGTKAERASEEASQAAASTSSITSGPPEGNRCEISHPTSDSTPDVQTPTRVGRHGKHSNNNTRVHDVRIPERTSSRSTVHQSSEPFNTMNVKEASETGHGQKTRLSERSLEQVSEENGGKDAGFVSTALRRLVGTDRSGGSSGSSTPRTPKRKHIVPDDMSPRTIIRLSGSDSLTPTARSLCGSGVAQENSKPNVPVQKAVVANAGTQTRGFQKVAGWKCLSDSDVRRPRKSDIERERPNPRTPRHSDETDMEFDDNSSIQITPKEYCAEMTVPQRSRNTGANSAKAL
ncbi:unnamed protein product [Colletotrichum noveboracense]|uniref:Rho-GAP domain-containing protein n=1 Tax=Colletotrichum noveboracense TaxID=2664923 RepID=A0A9W4RSG1_9PEZI|nr:unnamed protein product [Colletotrichum noveboracense]